MSAGPLGRNERRSRLAMLGMVAILGLAIAAGAVHYFAGPGGAIIDFDAFWLAGRLVWLGRAGEAYDFARFTVEQQSISTLPRYVPWTYPPPYDLVVAPLALLPRGIAYLGFVLVTLSGFLLMLHRVQGAEPVTVLAVILAPAVTAIVCGQNGFLTGALVGLAAIGLLRRRGWAGIALGLLIIKPHLAIGLALYVLLDRRWSVVAVAAATVAASLALSTIVLGTSIWPAFLAGAAQASDILAHGTYPFFRMISAYASLRTMRIDAGTAFAMQAAVALIALAGVFLAQQRLAPRDAIGSAILAGLLVSPYAYDYDLPVFGIGLALVLPTLVRYGRGWERAAIYVLVGVAGATGLVDLVRPPTPYGGVPGAAPDFVTLAGPLLALALLLVARVLARARAVPRLPEGVDPPCSSPMARAVA